MSKPFIFNCLI